MSRGDFWRNDPGGEQAGQRPQAGARKWKEPEGWGHPGCAFPSPCGGFGHSPRLWLKKRPRGFAGLPGEGPGEPGCSLGSRAAAGPTRPPGPPSGTLTPQRRAWGHGKGLNSQRLRSRLSYPRGGPPPPGSMCAAQARRPPPAN